MPSVPTCQSSAKESTPKVKPDRSGRTEVEARRLLKKIAAINRDTALRHAAVGLFVIQVDQDKQPIGKAWTQADVQMSYEDRELAEAAFWAEHGYAPVHVGATRETATIERIFDPTNKYAVGVSCGPSRLIAIDADRKDDAPRLVAEYMEANNLAWPEGAVFTRSQDGGWHAYFANPTGLGCRRGGFAKLVCHIKGRGGQALAQGSALLNGRTYSATGKSLVEAVADGSLPELPQWALDLLAEAGPETSSNITSMDEARIAKIISEGPQLDFDDAVSAEIGLDIENLVRRDDKFREVWNTEKDDHSGNRQSLANLLAGRCGNQFTPAMWYSIATGWEPGGSYAPKNSKGKGLYNLRDIAREWSEAQNTWAKALQDGSALEPVEDTEASPNVEAEADHAVDLAEHRETVSLEKKKTRRPLWEDLEGLADLEAEGEPINWLVDGLIEAGTLGLPYGVPGAGKSAVMLDLGLSVAHGLPWHGRAVRSCGVLFIAMEGPKGSKRRVRGWQDHARACGMTLDPHAPFFMVRRRVTLAGEKPATAAILKTVRVAEERSSRKVGLVIVDTLRASMPGEDENSARDVGIVMAALAVIAEQSGATVIAIHHSGKDPTKGASGSTNIVGAVDWSLEIGGGKIRTRKVRDADDGQTFGFRVIGVPTGPVKPDGTRDTTAVAVAVNAPTAGACLGDVADEDETPELQPNAGDETKSRAMDRHCADAITAARKLPATGFSRGELEDAVNAARQAADRLGTTAMRKIVTELVFRKAVTVIGTNRTTRYVLA